jgi:hypothetical protein
MWAPATRTPPNSKLVLLPIPLPACPPSARTLSSFGACLDHSEWAVNQHRDSLALYVGFDSLSQYISIAENETIGRVKFNALQVRVRRRRSPRRMAGLHLRSHSPFDDVLRAENDTTMWAASAQGRRMRLRLLRYAHKKRICSFPQAGSHRCRHVMTLLITAQKHMQVKYTLVLSLSPAGESCASRSVTTD